MPSVLARGRSWPDGGFVSRLPVAAGLPACATLLLQVPASNDLSGFDDHSRLASPQRPEDRCQELLQHDDRQGEAINGQGLAPTGAGDAVRMARQLGFGFSGEELLPMGRGWLAPVSLHRSCHLQ